MKRPLPMSFAGIALITSRKPVNCSLGMRLRVDHRFQNVSDDFLYQPMHYGSSPRSMPAHLWVR